MFGGIPAASSHAAEVDTIFYALTGLSVAIMGLVVFLVVSFAVRYRASSPTDRAKPISRTWTFEIGWTSATLVLFLAIFFWGAGLYIDLYTPPADAERVDIVGKQWMWKLQHRDGTREINDLHLPVGQDIQLVMTSEDVIHSFYVPALRVKQDAVPGRYTTLWFKPTRTGTYRIQCAEFCGTEHASMGGRVHIMEPQAYAAWLAEQPRGDDLAAQGEKLFRSIGCSGCHGAASTVKAPRLEGVFGGPVVLMDQSVITADERYIRDSILRPQSEIVAGYPPIMPSFAGQLDEQQILQLVEYIRSLAHSTRLAP